MIVIKLLKTLLEKMNVRVLHYLICTELHADSTKHLHVVLWLSGTVDTRNARFVDLIFGEESFHGDYRCMKREKDCVTYVTKYGDYLTDDRERIQRILSVKKTDAVALSLINGAEINEVLIDHPGLVMMNLERLQRFRAWHQRAQFNSIPLPKLNLNPCLQDALIMRWLALNLFGEPRTLRQPQLYLYGPPMMGKSTLISILETYLKVYKPSYRIHWWDEFDNNTQMLVLDEFKGQLPVTFLNTVLDGQRGVVIPRRNGDFVKNVNIPVIVLSNYPPYEVYQSNENIAAFVTRFTIVNVTTFIHIFE